MTVNIHRAEASDHSFLETMFVEAVLWDPRMPRKSLAELLQVPELRRYFPQWGRRGDVALVADVEQTLVGASWYRVFRSEEPGYGFVDESIPELGIAVMPEWRGRSIGTKLLGELLATARAHGYPGLSLSVSAANPARHLYERLGFVQVRDRGSAWTMLARFSP